MLRVLPPPTPSGDDDDDSDDDDGTVDPSCKGRAEQAAIRCAELSATAAAPGCYKIAVVARRAAVFRVEVTVAGQQPRGSPALVIAGGPPSCSSTRRS